MAKRIVVEFAGETRSLDAAFAKVKGTAGGTESTLKGLVAGAAFAGISDQIYGVVTAASDLNESLSKSNNVFGSSGSMIDRWAQGAAADFGLSRQAALETTSSFGNMFEQLGIGQGQAAGMSQKIVELAADFASFHNADITDVITAQQAAFRGEYDSLQRFLPTINAAAVQQEALKETGKKTTAQLTDQDKALATNTLMFKGAGAAAGDFDRTSGGLANQQRILKAEMANLRTELGDALLPAMTSATSFVGDTMIPTFEDLFNLKPPSGAAGGIGTFINNLTGDIAGFALAVPQEVLRGWGNLADVVGADGVAGDFRDAADGADDLRTKFHATTAEMANWAAETNAVDANQKLAHLATKNLVGSTTNLGGAAGKTAQQLADEEKATTALKDAQLDLRSSDLSLEESKHNLGVVQDAYNEFLETGGIDAEKVAEAQRTLIDAQKDTASATQDVAAAQEAVNEALKPATQRDQAKAGRDVAAAADDVTVAQLDLTDAQDEYAQLVYSGTASEEDLTRARIRANDAVRTLADAQDRLAEAQGTQTEVSQIGTTESKLYKDAVAVLTEKQGLLKDATDKQTLAQSAMNLAQGVGKDYSDKLWKATDDLKLAQLDLDQKTWGAQKAQLALRDATGETTDKIRDQWSNVAGLKDELAKLPSDIQIKINALFADPQNALGDITHDTGSILAGARASRGASAAAPINITVNGAVDSASTARQLVGILKDEQRRSGPLGLN